MPVARQNDVQTTFIECLVTAVCPREREEILLRLHYKRTAILCKFKPMCSSRYIDLSIQSAVSYHLRPVRQSQASHATSRVRRLFPDVCQRASNYETARFFLNSSAAWSVIARNILNFCVPFRARDFHASLKQGKIIFVVNKRAVWLYRNVKPAVKHYVCQD